MFFYYSYLYFFTKLRSVRARPRAESKFTAQLANNGHNTVHRPKGCLVLARLGNAGAKSELHSRGQKGKLGVLFTEASSIKVYANDVEFCCAWVVMTLLRCGSVLGSVCRGEPSIRLCL